MALRVLHEQLLHLLSPSEQQEFNLANAFASFAGEYMYNVPVFLTNIQCAL
jgi:hypothetical protein